MTISVYHDEWRIADSRRPFGIGDEVRWLVERKSLEDHSWLTNLLGDDSAVPIDWSEAATGYGRSLNRLVGTVESILAVLCRHEFPYGGSPVDGTGQLVSVTRADTIDPTGHDLTEPITIGYIAHVSLRERVEPIPAR
jgi:hypothetical protein